MTHGVVPHGMTMWMPLGKLRGGPWHESHVVWNFPPSACVHVTHGTWKMESKCEESERKFPLVGSKKKKKQFGGRKERKKKGMKGEKERKEEKEKKGEKKKRKEEMRGKKKEEKSVRGGERERKEKGFNFRCSDSRKLLVRELKLVYSTRATSRCQKQKR